MAKGLTITGLVLDMISGVLLSLGVLTPELVRNAGNRVASYIISRPKATFLAAAHFEVFEPEPEPEDLWGHFDKCLIEFAAFVLTWTIASAITLVILLSFSLWALMGTVSQPTANPVRFGLSIAGLLLSASGLCFHLVELPPVDLPETNNPLGKTLRSVLRAVAKVWSVSTPVVWVFSKLVSMFTMVLPRLWYRALKGVHRRGSEWLFTLAGIALFITGFILQLWAILVSS